MKIKFILILFFQFIFFNSILNSDEVEIVSGNTIIEGKGLQIKKNGEYIKIKGKAKLRMLLLQKNAY